MLNRLPIHQSLHRHAHVMGAERTLVMSSALVSFLVGIGGLTMISIISAILFWIFSVFFLRHMAKADPIMSQIWLKHIRKQTYYPAQARVWRRI